MIFFEEKKKISKSKSKSKRGFFSGEYCIFWSSSWVTKSSWSQDGAMRTPKAHRVRTSTTAGKVAMYAPAMEACLLYLCCIHRAGYIRLWQWGIVQSSPRRGCEKEKDVLVANHNQICSWTVGIITIQLYGIDNTSKILTVHWPDERMDCYIGGSRTLCLTKSCYLSNLGTTRSYGINFLMERCTVFTRSFTQPRHQPQTYTATVRIEQFATHPETGSVCQFYCFG